MKENKVNSNFLSSGTADSTHAANTQPKVKLFVEVGIVRHCGKRIMSFLVSVRLGKLSKNYITIPWQHIIEEMVTRSGAFYTSKKKFHVQRLRLAT